MDVSSGSGHVVVDLVDVSSYPYVASFADGAVIILKAKPSFGYVFKAWQGDLISEDNPDYIEMTCNKTVDAVFSLDWRLMGVFSGIFLLLVCFGIIFFMRRRSASS